MSDFGARDEQRGIAFQHRERRQILSVRRADVPTSATLAKKTAAWITRRRFFCRSAPLVECEDRQNRFEFSSATCTPAIEVDGLLLPEFHRAKAVRRFTSYGPDAPAQGLPRHRPMVGLVPHFAPSGEPPPGQNTDTRVSFASQFTVPSDCTDRMEALDGPASPFGPVSPFGPGAPCGPCGPWGPASP
jgi:hypothetical protein